MSAPKKERIMAFIPTKGRYNTTLPLVVQSIISQTIKPDYLLIIDDGEQRDLRKDFLWQHLFITLDYCGISWEVSFGAKKGQVISHNRSIDRAKELGMTYIWRTDDDCVPAPDCLEKLYSVMSNNVGAVGSVVLVPSYHIPYAPDIVKHNKIEDVLLMINSQWFRHKSDATFQTDHLCGIFLYRVEAASHKYNTDLSPVGHTEETQFTHEMKRSGWSLVVNPAAITWHYRAPSGGIRSYNNTQMYEKDMVIFKQKLETWGVKLNNYRLIILDNGIGDHCCFLSVYGKIREGNPPGTKFVIAPCWTEIFESFSDKLVGDEIILSLDEARVLQNPNSHNIYGFMADNMYDKKGKSMAEAFIERYTR
jgi:hypothetical protein